MGNSINQWVGSGRLGRDAEVRQAGNAQIVTLSIAVSEWKKDKNGQGGTETTHWVPVEKWLNKGDEHLHSLRRGQEVVVTGKLKMDTWQDKETGKQRQKLKVLAYRIDAVEDTRQGRGQGGGQGGGQGQDYSQGYSHGGGYQQPPPNQNQQQHRPPSGPAPGGPPPWASGDPGDF